MIATIFSVVPSGYSFKTDRTTRTVSNSLLFGFALAGRRYGDRRRSSWRRQHPQQLVASRRAICSWYHSRTVAALLRQAII